MPPRLAAWSGLFAAALLASAPAVATDDRRVRVDDSPRWLFAVGKLEVPGTRFVDGRRQHHIEDCSATLLPSPSGDRADTLVTAWHCLDQYRDFSKPLVVTFESDSGEPVARTAYRLTSGGGMHADWALLRLFQPLPAATVPALPVHPGRAAPDLPLVMAGFSGDPGLGARGARLTFDPGCHVTGRQRHATGTDCLAFKGASGGAVVQLTADGQAMLAGVVSEGDGSGYSSFVPVERFRSALALHLAPDH